MAYWNVGPTTWIFSALWLLSIASTAFASASTTADSIARCGVEEPEADQHGGAALLQLGSLSDSSSSSSSRKAQAAAAAAQSHKPGAAVNVAEEQLTQYAKLKQTLAQTKESAEIMRKIDEELDGRLDEFKGEAGSAVLLQAETLDNSKPEIDTDSQEVLAAQGPGGLQTWTLDGIQGKDAATHSRHRGNSAVSLVEARVEKPTHHKKHPEKHHKKHAKKPSHHGKRKYKDDDASDTDIADDDTSTEIADEVLTELDEDGDSADTEDVDADEVADSEDDDDEPSVAEMKRRSLVTVMDMIEADEEPLNENGYLDVVSFNNNRKMERFVTRLVDEMSLQIVDPGGLKGMVPYYSGQKSTQSFRNLQSELLSTARMGDGWLVKKRNKNRQSSRFTKGVLLQTDATQHTTQHKSKGTTEQVSLLGLVSTRASKAVHKVPDLAMALFGSRTAVVLCSIGLVACLFCLDERNRTSKGVEYEDPLNMSPTPPSVKQVFNANGKPSRGANGALAEPLQ